ncbi:carboxypeptidase-like regulatory domain-containing protein [Thalassococcus sp. BH17M4-6]|uniref:carboxypeptidase-like regulatory domain-containing protein n=1 Tax=Thalassococcus sp. BH17M4-6 TaxID=3413148 RepID=UPI003BDE7C54
MSVDILTRQALITGVVRDAISGAKPRRLVQMTVLRHADDRPLAQITQRIGADGMFVVAGDPAIVLPPQNITLRLEFRAQGYQPLDRQVVLTAADLARVDDNFDDGGTVRTASVIAGLPRALDLQLLPEPVTLKGRVARADNAAQPIENAQVQITAPAAVGPVATNAQGYFTLGPAPVADTVTLSITAAGFDARVTDVRLDFRQPVNTGAFALEQS